MKACLRCKETKPLSDFPLGRRKTKSGVTTYYISKCRECRRVEKTEWTRKNKDKVAQLYLKHRDTILSNRREKYIDNREKLVAECRVYYAAHKQEALNRSKKYRDEGRYSYVRSLFSTRVPHALVEAKRLQLLIKRNLKNEEHN